MRSGSCSPATAFNPVTIIVPHEQVLEAALREIPYIVHMAAPASRMSMIERYHFVTQLMRNMHADMVSLRMGTYEEEKDLALAAECMFHACFKLNHARLARQ